MPSNKIGEMYSDKLKGWVDKFARPSLTQRTDRGGNRNADGRVHPARMDEALALGTTWAAMQILSRPDPAKGGRFMGHYAHQGTNWGGHVHLRAAALDSMDDRLAKCVEKKTTRLKGHLASYTRRPAPTPGRTGGVIKKNDYATD